MGPSRRSGTEHHKPSAEPPSAKALSSIMVLDAVPPLRLSDRQPLPILGQPDHTVTRDRSTLLALAGHYDYSDSPSPLQIYFTSSFDI
eukprot:574963-Rhodomonas_salina.3